MENEKLIVIETRKELSELILKISSVDSFIAFDTETTGVKRDSSIIGVSVAWETSEGFYIILQKWIPEKGILEPTECVDTIHDLFTALNEKDLIMHNAIFDCIMVKNNFGIDLMPSVHTDTMLLAHTTDENRGAGLKDLAVTFFGEFADKEKREMNESIQANGGSCTKVNYELYKADPYLIGRYGAKDAILTLKIFLVLVPDLFEQKLNTFFYEDEVMPLLRGPTYDMNSTGFKVDFERLLEVKRELELEIAKADFFIRHNIQNFVPNKDKFNFNSNEQLAKLLFITLGNEFRTLTKKGRQIASELIGRTPYTKREKELFIRACVDKKLSPTKYLNCDKETLQTLAIKYDWVAELLNYKNAKKILDTYISPIAEKSKYGIQYSDFLQHGTTSGRFSSRSINFQNLPRSDKRVKSCFISRPGRSFVGADQSQLEPRVFASLSGDFELQKCFSEKKDIYSVIGMAIFNKTDCSPFKKDKDFFGNKYPHLRHISKVIMLAVTYGTTAGKLSQILRDDEGFPLQKDQCQFIIDNYFLKYPSVKEMIDRCHLTAIEKGVVHSLYGRPRRIPEAKIISIYGNTPKDKLPYNLRSLLNLSVNHGIQSSAASIMNRSAIALHKYFKDNNMDAKIVSQVHDELIVECADNITTEVKNVLKKFLETTVPLPGVVLEAEPTIAKRLSDLK